MLGSQLVPTTHSAECLQVGFFHIYNIWIKSIIITNQVFLKYKCLGSSSFFVRSSSKKICPKIFSSIHTHCIKIALRYYVGDTLSCFACMMITRFVSQASERAIFFWFVIKALTYTNTNHTIKLINTFTYTLLFLCYVKAWKGV